MRKIDEVQDEFEQELTQRMRRVDPPEGFMERLLERAEAEAPSPTWEVCPGSGDVARAAMHNSRPRLNISSRHALAA